MNTIDNGLLENEISPQDQSEGYMEIVPDSKGYVTWIRMRIYKELL